MRPPQNCDECGARGQVTEWHLTCDRCEADMGVVITWHLPRKQYCARCYDLHYAGEIELEGVEEPIPF